MAYNLNAGYPYFSYTLSGSLIVFLVGIPLLTMRSFSEERKTKNRSAAFDSAGKSDKSSAWQIFRMVTVLAVPNVIFCLFPLLIKLQGTAYLLVDYSSIAVFFLLGCVYLAIGMFMSSLTESQIIAFYQYVRNFAFVVFVGRNLVFSAKLGAQRNDRNPFDPDTDRCLYLII